MCPFWGGITKLVNQYRMWNLSNKYHLHAVKILLDVPL